MAGCSQENTKLLDKRNMLLTYILNNAANKLPMLYSEFNALLDREKNIVSELIPLVTTALKGFGIILEEVPNKKNKRKFICFADDTAKSLLEFTEEQKSHNCLLFIILSYIFMKGGDVYEDQLEKFLNGFDIYYDEPHSYFGSNIKKLITDTFVKQLYLDRHKSDSEFDIETKFNFSWGYRAHKEFKKTDLLNVTAMVMNRSATFFETHYKEANVDIEDEGGDVEMID